MTRNYTLVKEYILNAIDATGYDNTIELKEPADKLQWLFETFQSEYGWAIKQQGQLKALAEWLAGLPSSIDIAFYNHDVIELGKQWGNKLNRERDIHNWTNNWFKFLAMRLQSLWNKYNIK